jgi:hypothetical protein
MILSGITVPSKIDFTAWIAYEIAAGKDVKDMITCSFFCITVLFLVDKFKIIFIGFIV